MTFTVMEMASLLASTATEAHPRGVLMEGAKIHLHVIMVAYLLESAGFSTIVNESSIEVYCNAG